MKQRIDLQKASEAEAFGALAVGADREHGNAGVVDGRFTPAQHRALSDLARSLVKAAREAGAQQERIIVDGVYFELRENGIEEILSIRTAIGS